MGKTKETFKKMVSYFHRGSPRAPCNRQDSETIDDIELEASESESMGLSGSGQQNPFFYSSQESENESMTSRRSGQHCPFMQEGLPRLDGSSVADFFTVVSPENPMSSEDAGAESEQPNYTISEEGRFFVSNVAGAGSDPRPPNNDNGTVEQPNYYTSEQGRFFVSYVADAESDLRPPNNDNGTVEQLNELAFCEVESNFFTVPASPLEAPMSSGCADAANPRPPHNRPRLEITKQPESSRRFRYPSDVDSAGPIRGVNDRAGHKTYPTLKIWNYTGPAVIMVSLVTREAPYRVHPAIVDKNFSELYLVQVEVTENYEFEFKHLSIQTPTRLDIHSALTFRETQFREHGIYPVWTDDVRESDDPLQQGFAHKDSPPNSINMHAVRLCFHLFSPDLSQQLAAPVVSDVIANSRNNCDLEITKVCGGGKCTSGGAQGGAEFLFFCKPVNKKDIEVVFYEEENGVLWEAKAEVQVHYKTGIACKAPPYKRPVIYRDVQVWFELRRPSDDSRSNSEPFTYHYVPETIDEIIARKKPKRIDPRLLQIANDSTALMPPPDDDWSNRDYLLIEQDLQSLLDGLAEPGPSHRNPDRPGPSHGNPDRPGPSHGNPDRPGPSHGNPVRPGPSHGNPVRPGPSHGNPDRPGPSHGNPVRLGQSHGNPDRPRPSHSNPDRPGPSHGNPVRPGPSHSNSDRPGPSHGNPDRPGPSHGNSVRPGPSHSNPDRPGPSHGNPDRPGPSHGNSVIPGQSHGSPAVPGSQANLSVQEICVSQLYEPGPVYMQHPAMIQNLQVLQQNMQNIPPNIRSSNMQPRPSNMQCIPPNMEHLSPVQQPMPPNMQPMSQDRQLMSPDEQLMSPDAGLMSPDEQLMSPYVHVLPPDARLMSPDGRLMSPDGRLMSPDMQPISSNIQSLRRYRRRQ